MKLARDLRVPGGDRKPRAAVAEAHAPTPAQTPAQPAVSAGGEAVAQEGATAPDQSTTTPESSAAAPEEEEDFDDLR